MTLLEKLPGMADDALANLHANALRLGEAGSKAQRSAAAELLPALEAELSARKTAKRERQAEARKARASRVKAANA
jgi:hypothetical protein